MQLENNPPTSSPVHTIKEENLDLLSESPFDSLSDELILKIFSHLNISDLLGPIRHVCKRWECLAKDPLFFKKVFYKKMKVFDNDKWIQYCGADVIKDEDKKNDFLSFPLNEMVEDFIKYERTFPKKKAEEDFIIVKLPKRLNGGLNLMNCGKLLKVKFPYKVDGYEQLLSKAIKEEFKDKSIAYSRWVLFLKERIQGSENLDYPEQVKKVQDLAVKSQIEFDVPETLEAIACISSQFFFSKTRLYENAAIRCKEKVLVNQVYVGNFKASLQVVGHDPLNAANIGISAVKRYKSVIIQPSPQIEEIKAEEK